MTPAVFPPSSFFRSSFISFHNDSSFSVQNSSPPWRNVFLCIFFLLILSEMELSSLSLWIFLPRWSMEIQLIFVCRSCRLRLDWICSSRLRVFCGFFRVFYTEDPVIFLVNLLLTKTSRIFTRERTVFSTNGARTIGAHIQEDEFRSWVHTIHKDLLKMNQRPKCKRYKDFPSRVGRIHRFCISRCGANCIICNFI